MTLRLLVLFTCLIFSSAYGAEFEKNKKPVKILELNEKTLLQNVWPGMTIKQAMQILGEPEELREVKANSSGSPAIRYGTYWLIPQYDGVQIVCILNQRGLRTQGESVRRCSEHDDKYKLSTQ